MLRPTVPGTILLLPCFHGDRMPRVPLDTSRDYRLRVLRPDSARRYAMREYRIPLCPPGDARGG